MGTNTILRNVLLLEGKDYTPEQIDDILNNRLRAINYATNIADRPSYAAALDLRSRAILTEAGKVDALSRKDVVDALQPKYSSPLKQAVYLIKLFSNELPFEHSNEAIGYLLACKVLLDNGESKDIINKALDDDALLVNILSNQSLGEAYGSDYECAKQFVSQIIL